jgi:hypothetical protein
MEDQKSSNWNIYQVNKMYVQEQMSLNLPPSATDRKQSSSLDLSVTSGLLDVLRASSSAGSSDVLTLEAREHAGVRAGQSARGTVGVHLAVVAEVRLARRVVAGRSKDLASKASLGSGNNVLEDVALSDDLGASVGLEGVLGVGVEVVVDSVEEGVAGDLGRAAGGVVDVVALHGDEVVGAGQVDSPVVADQAVAPLISQLEMVTRLEAVLPRTMC